MNLVGVIMMIELCFGGVRFDVGGVGCRIFVLLMELEGWDLICVLRMDFGEVSY